MNTNHLQSKRKSPPGSFFRKLRANTARRQRVPVPSAPAAAATASPDLGGHVPHVGVGWALLVLLAVHLVVVAAIFVHSHCFDSQPTSAVPNGPSPDLSSRDGALPKLSDDDKPHMIVTGDTYETVAARYGVTLDDLRRANANMPLRAGRILRIPPLRISAVEPAEMASRRDAARMTGRGQVAGMTEPADSVSVVGAPRAVLVRAKAPVTTRAAGGAAHASGATYTVKSGDTPGRIAARHGVTVERLMQANGLKDAKHLRVGMEIKIPKS